MAVDNSRLYEREHRVATALQQAMLPTHLPNVVHVEFGSVYRPAERESQVGGDWYDAFIVAGNKAAVSIGDVGGHGLGAAVAMSEARQALRVSALEGLPPSEVLRRANSAVSLNDKAPIITAIFGTIDPARGKFTFSSAGHPPAILAPLSRDAYYLQGRHTAGNFFGCLIPQLGNRLRPVLDAAALHRWTHRIQPRHREGKPTVVGRDDEQSERHECQWRASDRRLHAPSIMRRFAGRFARGARLSQDRTCNLILAVGEAVANAIEHAYGGRNGRLRLRLSMPEESVVGEVYDEGRWRRGAPAADRGRGLTILHSLTKRLHLQSTPRGTTLTFEI